MEVGIRTAEVEIPRLGRVTIRELGGLEFIEFQERATSENATRAQQWRALCDLLGANIGREDLHAYPMETVLALQREVYALSKVDAPELEDIPEGHEYETHAEAAAQDFIAPPPG